MTKLKRAALVAFVFLTFTAGSAYAGNWKVMVNAHPDGTYTWSVVGTGPQNSGEVAADGKEKTKRAARKAGRDAKKELED
jgi:hypothetical protein